MYYIEKKPHYTAKYKVKNKKKNLDCAFHTLLLAFPTLKQSLFTVYCVSFQYMFVYL